MKRFVLALAGIALLFFAGTSCKKDKGGNESVKPTITWEANADFAQVQIGESLDAVITINAPEGIQDLTLKFTSIPAVMIGTIATHLDIKENWQGANANTPVIDLVADAKAVAYIKSLKMASVSTFSGAESVVLNFKPLVEALTLDWSTSESIDIQINVTDKNGKSVSKKASFLFTPAPIISSDKLIFSVKALGEVEEAVLTVNSSSTTFNNMLKGIGGEGQNGSIKLNLIDNTSVISNGSKLKGQKEVSIDITNYVNTVGVPAFTSDKSVGDHKFTLTIIDANGKSGTNTAVYTYTLPE